jgi:adenylate cyclase
MNARLERKLRLLAGVVAVGVLSGLVFNIAQGRTLPSAIMVGGAYGLLMSITLGGIELFVLDGPLRMWLSGLSFTVSLIVRSTIYGAIIVAIQWFQLGEFVAGLPLEMSSKTFWSGLIYSAVISVAMNLVLGIGNIVGQRAFLNFITGRYHTPVDFHSEPPPPSSNYRVSAVTLLPHSDPQGTGHAAAPIRHTSRRYDGDVVAGGARKTI